MAVGAGKLRKLGHWSRSYRSGRVLACPHSFSCGAMSGNRSARRSRIACSRSVLLARQFRDLQERAGVGARVAGARRDARRPVAGDRSSRTCTHSLLYNRTYRWSAVSRVILRAYSGTRVASRRPLTLSSQFDTACGCRGAARHALSAAARPPGLLHRLIRSRSRRRRFHHAGTRARPALLRSTATISCCTLLLVPWMMLV